MLADVRAGLSLPQKELSPKYFYDRRGSQLFEDITRLPEYYLTRAERALLERWMPSRLETLQSAALVELGAGSAEKTRIVLDAMVAAGSGRVYVPVDVSAEFLAETAEALREEYPTLGIVPALADIAEDFDLPEILPHPVLYAFLGSTIGNFDPPSAVRLLARVARAMSSGDRFLLGADLKKDIARIEAAYNDAQGVTAEFNLNVLRVLNREVDASFDLDAFSHLAFYNREHDRIEMHLVSAREQDVCIPAIGLVHFRAGETIRTEISCKYDRERIAAMFAAAGLRIDEWCSDADATHALVLAVKA
jgi:L-histidine N-alpha-methyltransferase